MGIVASLLPPCLPEDGSTFSSVRGSRPPPSESDPAGEEGKFKIAEPPLPFQEIRTIL